MNEKPFLSIIVPVYNVCAYLPSCIDSITGQSFSDLELLLVDDGSTDGSAELCDQYAQRDARIRSLHKENGGASDARNAGIRAASGQYLLFIDADDFIEADSLAQIAGAMREEGDRDVAILQAKLYLPDGKCKPWVYSYDKARIDKRGQGEALKYFVEVSSIPISPCVKLVRRDFLLAHKLFFTTGIIHEDVDWTASLLLRAETCNYFDFPYYCRRYQRPGSVTNSTSAVKKFCDLLVILNKWATPDASEPISGMMALQYCVLLTFYHALPSDRKAEYQTAVKDLSWLFGASSDRRIHIIKTLYRLLGLRTTAAILHAGIRI